MSAARARRTPFYKALYIQVLFGVVCGILLGYISGLMQAPL